MNPAHVAREFVAPDHRIVFRFDGQPFTVKDVIDSAWLAGELNGAWAALLAAEHCEQIATEQGLESDDEVLQTFSEEFRYEHDLLTSEETERWLRHRDLTEDDFVNYFLRRYWRGLAESAPAESPLRSAEDVLVGTYPSASFEHKQALRADLWLSGELDRLAKRLAWRIVALAHASSESIEAMKEARGKLLTRHGWDDESMADALSQLGRSEAWLESELKIDVAYAQVLDRLLTRQSRGHELQLRRLGLTRVEMETLQFRTADAVREALLCLENSETSMDELAHECGAAKSFRCLFIENCADSIQHALWSAIPGQYLSLEQSKESFSICHIIGKQEPCLEDEEVRSRIDAKLKEAGFADLAGKSIRWPEIDKAPA